MDHSFIRFDPLGDPCDGVLPTAASFTAGETLVVHRVVPEGADR